MKTVDLDLEVVLEQLDQMAAQRPVAARIVAATNNESSGVADLTAMLSADVTLAAKVMKLANSAYFGLSGRVTNLHFAVTVVGFNAVRSVATVALSGTDGADVLPDGFWDTSLHLAAAAGVLGPQFQERAADAMCLGLLAQLGAALLHQADREGYDDLAASTSFGRERFAGERRRYGISAPQLTAEALQQWCFPEDMVEALRGVVQPGQQGALLRAAYELTGRLLARTRVKNSLELVSNGRITESQAPARLVAIRADVEELRAALGL